MMKTTDCGECDGQGSVVLFDEREAADGLFDLVVVGTEGCDFCDGTGVVDVDVDDETVALNERLRRDGVPGYAYADGRGWYPVG